jgi:hypothetical protein
MEKNVSMKEMKDLFIKMLKNLEPDNRDYLINSFLNELRYPNSQTKCFLTIINVILSDIKNEEIEEHLYR